MLAEARDVTRRWQENDKVVETRDVVEARIVEWALFDLKDAEKPVA